LFLGSFALASAPETVAAQAGLQVGYQFLRYAGQDGGDGVNFPLGFAATGNFPVKGAWSAVGDLTWGRHSEEIFGEDTSFSETTVTGGVRWTEMRKRFGAQFLMGLNHEGISDCNDCSSNDVVITPGIIARIPANGSWNAFGRLDYRHVFFEGEGANGFALIFGVELPLKK